MTVDVEIITDNHGNLIQYNVIGPSQLIRQRPEGTDPKIGVVAKHAQTHEWRTQRFKTDTSGTDQINVQPRMLSELRVNATKPPSMKIHMNAGFYMHGVSRWVGHKFSENDLVPPDENMRYDLVYLDTRNNTLEVQQGQVIVTPNGPRPRPSEGQVPLAWILMQAGMTEITEAHITDGRVFISAVGASGFGNLVSHPLTPAHDGESGVHTGLLEPAFVDDASDDLATHQGVMDPSSGFPNSLYQEILQLRYMLKWIGGGEYWYSEPAITQTISSGFMWHQFIFTAEGDLETGDKPICIYVPGTFTIDSVFLSVSEAPTTQSILVQVYKNGVALFTSENRPAILAEALTGTSSTLVSTTLAANDYLTFGIDQVGTGVVGSDLTVHVRCKQTLQAPEA